MNIIPFAGASITGYLLLYSYYIYSSFNTIRLSSERQIFYINTITTLYPAIIYSYSLINHMILNHPFESFLIQNFVIEWSITTPLILLNITNLARVKLYKQCILCAVCSCMFVLGFIAYGIKDLTVALIPYILSCLCLCIIFYYILWIYYKLNWTPYRNNVQYEIYIKFLNTLFFIVISTWSLYPVVFIFYKYEFIDLESSGILFMVLDFISKGVFIGNIIRHQDLLCMLDSFTNQIQNASRDGRPEVPSSVASVLPIEETPLVIDFI